MMGLFASPVKRNLKLRIEARAKAAEARAGKVGGEKVDGRAPGESKTEGLVEKGEEQVPALGLPENPQEDFEEMVEEVRADIRRRQSMAGQRGSTEPILKTNGM